MFNLEQAIVGWRRQMLAAGIKTPVPLEELESHLRDEIEQRAKTGISPQQAFEAAIQRMGQARVLKSEFQKIERNIMKRIVVILAALFGTVFGGAMVLPALGRWHHTGTLVLYPLLVGIVLIAVGAGVSLYGIKSYREARGRKIISLGIIAAGIFYVVPFIQAFFIREIDWKGWMFSILLAAVSILFFGSCYRVNRLQSE